jgi:hypothetical protein
MHTLDLILAASHLAVFAAGWWCGVRLCRFLQNRRAGARH